MMVSDDDDDDYDDDDGGGDGGDEDGNDEWNKSTTIHFCARRRPFIANRKSMRMLETCHIS